jgi:signal transduction histidine kinase
MEYKKTFVQYISHEVGSPLSTISLGLQVLQDTIHDCTTQVDTLNTTTTSNTTTAEAEDPSETINNNNNNNNNMIIMNDHHRQQALVNMMNSLQVMIASMTEITQDCQIANELAIDTLNDLLLYDKIESQMLTLEPQIVSISTFLTHVIKPFFALVRYTI